MLVLCFDYPNEFSIRHARRFNEEEKQRFVPAFREYGLVAIGPEEKLEYISWKDSPKRSADGVFCGSENHAWIVSEEEADAFRSLNAARMQAAQEKRAADEALQREKEAQRAAEEAQIRAHFERWDVTLIEEFTAKHTFRIGGETLVFLERDIFDYGRAVNPDYAIAPGIVSGLCDTNADNVLVWMHSVEGAGWQEVRPLTEHEALCLDAVYKFGAFAGSPTRM